jgi:zinc transport system substrate-binding protein
VNAALGCLLAAAAAVGGPLQVAVSIAPQAGIVERIGGDRVTVEVLVPPDGSPATYEPTPQQLARLDGAAFLVSVGVPFEDALLPRLARIAPHLEVVDGLRGIERAPMEEPVAGPDPHRHAGRPDPHVWLDPERLAIHARTVAGALAAADPGSADGYRERLERLEGELAAADRRAAELLAPLEGRTVLVFHPAYGYLLRRYGLRQLAVEVEGKEPSPRQLAAIVDAARESGTRVVFVQPQFAGGAAAAVAQAIGGRLETLDPVPADPVAGIEEMARRIADALGG